MKFNKIQKLLKKGEKKEKELDSNPISDLVHALTPERKDRTPASEEEPEIDVSDLEEKKRKRYEEIMKKYK